MKEGIICSFSNAPVEKSHCDEVAVIHPQRDSGIFFLEGEPKGPNYLGYYFRVVYEVV
jgi:hypothetical protein